MTRVNPKVYPPGSVVSISDGRIVVVCDHDGNTIPYPHGEPLPRATYPALHEAVAKAYPERATRDSFTLPDMRASVIRTDTLPDA